MARIVISSTLPLRTAASHTVGRQVVAPTLEYGRTLSGEAITLDQLPGSPLPSEAELSRALRQTVRSLEIQGNPSLLRDTIVELLTRVPADRYRMCAKSRSLAVLWDAFKSALLQVDPAPPLPDGPLLVVGFAPLSDTELRTIDAAARDGSVIILPPAEVPSSRDTALALKRLGWTVQGELPPDRPDVGERLATHFITGHNIDMAGVNVQAAADLHQECVLALTTLAALTGEPLLVVPDLALYAPELEAVAFDLGITLDLPLPRALASTRLGAWLAELFHVLGGDWHGPSVRRVLGHPLARDVTPALLQAASRVRAGQRNAWLDLGLPRWLREWPEEGTYEQFAELTFKVLDGLDSQHLTPDDHRAGQQLMNDVDDLTAQTHVVSMHDFAEDVLQRLKGFLPPQSGPGWPVRTIETVAGRFDHVAILGLSEGLLPAPPTILPMLDFHDRQQLWQEGIQCRTALDAVHARDLAFWTALGAAKQSLRLSWPQRLGKRQQQPGAYLGRLGLAGPAFDQLDSDEQGVTALGMRFDPSGLATGSLGHAVSLKQHTFSATQLTRLSQCPYRWYAQHVLGLEAREESGAFLLPQERGRFNHRVLELVGRAAKDQSQARDVMLDHFPAAFEQAETEQGLTKRAAWPQQRSELHRRLQRTLDSPDFIQSGATIIGVERSFDVRWNGLRVTGKIDRIDQIDGELFVTDYKSGSSLPSGLGSSRDVQLNLYLDVVTILYPDLRAASGRYLSLGNTERRVLGRVQHQPGALDELLGGLQAAADTGHFPARPGSYCATCPLPSLCRQSIEAGEEA